MLAIRVGFLFLLICVALTSTVAAAAPQPHQPCELGVYTYDSIAGRGGLGDKIFPAFEKLSGCSVRVLASGDAIQMLGRVEIDLKRGKPSADVILGVDNLLWERTAPLVEPLAANALGRSPAVRLEPPVRENLAKFPGFVPYDFGVLALIANERQLAKGGLKPPGSLGDLLAPQWRRNLILEDPRTSSPGLQFLLFTKAALGTHFAVYWKALRSQWLTMPAGWDTGYGLFLKGQAPLVWSYVTSEAFEREHASASGRGGERYRALLFREGQPVQIEGAAEVRGAAHPKIAGKFLLFLLSKEVQSQIAETNWMRPVLRGVALPRSFTGLPVPSKSWVLSGEDSATVLKEWSEAIH